MSTAVLPAVQAQLIRYATTTILFLGCFGNAYVVFLFVRHRGNACALFLLSAALMNIVYLALSIPLNVYTNEHGDPSVYSMALCKLRFYLFHVWGQMSRYFILLACIDRFALTHRNASVRLLSRPLLAQRLIVITTIFWHLFALHILVMTTIRNGRCGYFDLYSTLNSVYVLTFVCILPPVGMAIFGYLSLRNMKRIHTRVQPSGTSQASVVIHRQDRNLLVMVLAEVLVYVVTMSLYPAIIFELAVTSPSAASKSTDQVRIENFILFFAQILIYINTSAPFYIYMIVSKTFRADFRETIRSIGVFLRVLS